MSIKDFNSRRNFIQATLKTTGCTIYTCGGGDQCITIEGLNEVSLAQLEILFEGLGAQSLHVQYFKDTKLNIEIIVK